MGKQRKNCWKCAEKHYPPTGRKCERTELLNSTRISSSVEESGVAGPEAERDSNVISSTSKTLQASSSQGTPDAIQKQILEQLQRVNQRLDDVEGRIETGTQHSKSYRAGSKGKKLSSTSHRTVNKSMLSDSESSEDEPIPSLNCMRRSEKIQREIDSRIRELELQSEATGTGAKIKSKRGGNVDVLVKNKVAWPHEAILGGATRARLTYDQLTMSQWVQGFCKDMLDEPDPKIRENMIQYMEELFEDATDFSWQGAKAAHTVLLCEFERGSVNWENTARIDRIRRAHAQKHIHTTKLWPKNEKNSKPWYCKQFQIGACSFAKDHEVNGKTHKHICSFCVGQGRFLGHAEKDCIFSKRHSQKKRISSCPSIKKGGDSMQVQGSVIDVKWNTRVHNMSKM